MNRARVAMACAAVVALTAACGTRVESEGAPAQAGDQVAARSDLASNSIERAAGASGGITSESGGGHPEVANGATSSPPPAGGPAMQTGAAASGFGGRAEAPVTMSSTPAGSPSPAQSGGAAAGAAPGGPSGSAGGSVVPGGGSPAGARWPVRIGTVSTMSGPIGDTLGGAVKAAQVWVRWINDRGGVNGHPVEFKIWDDGGDPARHRSQLQEAIERFGVVAFLTEIAPSTAEQSLDYLTSKNVPVIGTDMGNQWHERSPLYFLHAAYGKGLEYVGVAAIARRAKVIGGDKFGSVVCQEVPGCHTTERYWHQYAVGAGLKSVYAGRASLAQPEFTAQCLAARNAGANFIAFSMDANSITRMAASCARQGYHPVYVTMGPLMLERFAADPNLDGMVLGTNLMPYVWTSNPAAVEFLDAMKQYAPGTFAGASQASGWVAAKLFERAAANMPEPPTAAAVLQGLWRIKGDTLGGITQPLTFTEGKSTTQDPSCGFDMIVEKGQWKSPDGFIQHCGSPS